MKKNKSQIIFFILSVATAAVLLCFLYTYRQKEHSETERLRQEALSGETSVLSAGTTDPSVSADAAAQQNADASGNDTQEGSTDVIPAASVSGNAEESPSANEAENGQPPA